MSMIKDVSFANKQGQSLSGKLHLPSGAFRGAGIFAHCFTCSKQSVAASRIAAGLARAGIAVLRFDFTGLGNSAGSFAETSFASNLDDLVAAAAFMSNETIGAHSLSPQLLIGHSLGGAAVLSAAPRIESIKAIATIGAPAQAGHVLHIFGDNIDEITEKGSAELKIGGRPLTVGAGLVDDLKNRLTTDHISELSHDLLILHAPRDAVVGIENAAAIFQAAKHPKSFVSLDGADHLLTSPEDSVFAADMISSWASRALGAPRRLVSATEGDVYVASSPDGDFAHNIAAGPHQMRADEPLSVPGGFDSGPPPYDFLLAGLGACTGMTLRQYAKRKNWPLEDVDVHLSHKKQHQSDSTGAGKLDSIERVITFTGDLDEEQKARLLEIADKCPVHKSLGAGIDISTTQA